MAVVLSMRLSASASDAPLAQGFDDLFLGAIGHDVAVIDDDQAIDQFQQGGAVRHQQDGLVGAGFAQGQPALARRRCQPQVARMVQRVLPRAIG